jgi:uncharacterized protein YdeI (YjbR/CyaY-like superfamily)
MNSPLPFTNSQDWSEWLAANPTKSEVWMLLHKKASGIPSITWEQAVVEALAHGWIDGVKKSLNDTQWLQRFTPRKPGSAWSQKNIAHAEKLMADGRMTAAGMAHVTAAKANGRWDTAYSGGRNAALPQDFLDAVAASPQAQMAVQTLDSKNRYAIYYRLTTVKRPETRAKRIAGFIARLERGEKPHP